MCRALGRVRTGRTVSAGIPGGCILRHDVGGKRDHTRSMKHAVAKQVRSWIQEAMVQGGDRARAARKAAEIIGILSSGIDPDKVARPTGHGETRLRCYKYDLGNGYRLISQRRGAEVILVYVDSHEGCDRWLDQRQGES